MPLIRSPFYVQGHRSESRLVTAVLAVAGLLVLVAPAAAQPRAIRSQTAEIHYQLAGTSSEAEVELWYTRDRGATWAKYGIDQDHRSPLYFIAPAEGLYGLTLIVRQGQHVSASPPGPFDQPQRWIFIDYTPPLAQWLGVEPDDDFTSQRTVQLRWTAHDDNLENRPISLAWQSSIDQQWKTIAADLPNTGRYDWTVPAGTTGQITLKLTVRDRGGHVVERLLGPVPVSTWLASVSTRAAGVEEHPPAGSGQPTSAPADLATTRPAGADLATRQKAQERYQQGNWHLTRGQYALAAERFREALELNPGMLEAMNGLAGIYYLQEDYDQATRLYEDVLKRDSRHPEALRGAALAHVARKHYAQSRDMLTRLLAVNDKDAEALLDLGDVLFMMGDRDGARQHWRRAATADVSATEVVAKARRRMDLYRTTPSSELPVAAGHR